MKRLDLTVRSHKVRATRQAVRYVCNDHKPDQINRLVRSRSFRRNYGIIDTYTVAPSTVSGHRCAVCSAVPHA